MARICTVIFLVFAFAKANSQNTTSKEMDTAKTKQVVRTFFEFFHQKDTASLKQMFSEKAMLHSLMVKGDKSIESFDSLQGFLEGIAKIPDEIKFKETISDLRANGDENIASVSMDHTFEVNGKKSHSGKNIFLMLKTREGWKITSIADSRVYN